MTGSPVSVRACDAVHRGAGGAPVSSGTGAGMGAEAGAGASGGVFAGRLSVASCRPALDPHGMHRAFPGIWAEYLALHYASRRGRIMEAFDVDDRTVRAWLAGMNAPSGHKVAIAAARHPAFFAALKVAA